MSGGMAARLDAPAPRSLDDLGGVWDLAILDECRRFVEADEQWKRAVREPMDRNRSWAIVSWAEGMASLAVREHDRQYLVLGLVGLSLFDHRDFDARDAAVVFPLFVRAAELIGEDADDITGTAAKLTDSIGHSWLLSLSPSPTRRTQATHDEIGSGRSFAFRRRGDEWNPETELADFSDGDELKWPLRPSRGSPRPSRRAELSDLAHLR